MSEQKVHQRQTISCHGCGNYICTLDILVDPERMTYDSTGLPLGSREIVIAEVSSIRCRNCKKKTDFQITCLTKTMAGAPPK